MRHRFVPGAAGVVDVEVEPAERVKGRFDHPHHRVFIRNVRHDAVGAAAGRVDRRDDVRRGTKVGDGDVGAFRCKRQGGGAADAGGAAGHQRPLPLSPASIGFRPRRSA